MCGMTRHWITIAFLAASAAAATHPSLPNSGLARAEQLYRRAEYRAAIDTLQALDAKDAAGYALLGKAYFMEGQYKDALANLQKAAGQDCRSSDYEDWLGKAYGRVAETSSFVTARGYAKKTVHAFERAVELDPSNVEALTDVFEYYLEAPGIVGGGIDKAENVARRMAELNAAEYHWQRARLAEKRKEFAAAEGEFRSAIEGAPGDVGRTLDLAGFLASRGRYAESEALFHAADEKYPDSPKVMYARAAAYIQSKRNLEQAEALLERYLQTPITSEEPAHREAAALLKMARDVRQKNHAAE